MMKPWPTWGGGAVAPKMYEFIWFQLPYLIRYVNSRNSYKFWIHVSKFFLNATHFVCLLKANACERSQMLSTATSVRATFRRRYCRTEICSVFTDWQIVTGHDTCNFSNTHCSITNPLSCLQFYSASLKLLDQIYEGRGEKNPVFFCNAAFLNNCGVEETRDQLTFFSFLIYLLHFLVCPLLAPLPPCPPTFPLPPFPTQRIVMRLGHI